ncbi:MAG: hypothetical protein C0469_09055 [Cyanobacteria bacterium DS2.3.42]|nr:hypothetical protein [Cyanobacteria bacterium DS2.3.42]
MFRVGKVEKRREGREGRGVQTGVRNLPGAAMERSGIKSPGGETDSGGVLGGLKRATHGVAPTKNLTTY